MDFFRFDFRLFDAHVRGLQQFEIENFELRILRPSLNFEFFFKQLTVDGQHSTRARLSGIPVNGNGSIVMTFNDVRVTGSVAINTLDGGYLNVDALLFNFNVGSVSATLRGFGTFLDPTISLAISAALPTLINEGQERINEVITDQILPSLNNVLNQYRFIDLIFAIFDALSLNQNTNEINTKSNCVVGEAMLEAFQQKLVV